MKVTEAEANFLAAYLSYSNLADQCSVIPEGYNIYRVEWRFITMRVWKCMTVGMIRRTKRNTWTVASSMRADPEDCNVYEYENQRMALQHLFQLSAYEIALCGTDAIWDDGQKITALSEKEEWEKNE